MEPSERTMTFTSISIHTSTVNQIRTQLVHDSIPRLREIAAGTTADYKGLKFSVASYIELAVREKMQRDNNAPSSNQSQPDGHADPQASIAKVNTS